MTAPTIIKLAEVYADRAVGPAPKTHPDDPTTYVDERDWALDHENAFRMAQHVLDTLRCTICSNVTDTPPECAACHIREDAAAERRADR